MKNIANKLTALIMIVYLACGAAFMIFGRKYNVPKDMKNIALNGINDDVNKAAAKKLPKWKKVVSFDSRLRSNLNESIVNGVYIGSDMMLDATAKDEISTSAISKAINSFNKKYNGTVYLAAIPTSSGVYENLLPEYLWKNSETHRISQLYNELDTDIRKIDAYNILKMLSENYIYYRTDSKWTSYGAYCVYRTVVQKLGFSPVPYDKYTIDHVTDNFKGDLYNRTFYTRSKPDIIDVYRYPSGAEIVSCIGYDSEGKGHSRMLYDKNELDSGYMYNVYLGERTPLLKITTSISNDRKLLVIADSFGDCFIPFLTQHYSEIAFISLEQAKRDISDYIDLENYEQALILFGADSMENSSIFDIINERK